MSRIRGCYRSEHGVERLLRWLSTSPGRDLVELENACVEEMLADLFGYYLLQIGWTRSFVVPIARSTIRHHIAMENVFPGLGGEHSVVAHEGALPIAHDSVDAVFLPHTLDFSADPHQVLRESERVLIPEGRLLLLGFNPWGTWGVWRLLRKRGGEIPWCGHFLSPRRVEDWLNLLGFDVEVVRPLMFMPPLRNHGMMCRGRGLETFAGRWLGGLSAAYAIRAVKRVSTLTPIAPRWQARSKLLPGQAVEPSARTRSG